MIDSHTHLDSCAPPNAELVADARAVGVTHLVTVGMDERTNRTALAAAHEFPEVYAALGRHPNSAGGWGAAALADLRELAADPRCVAIGETGLDYFREHAAPAEQMTAFHAQIELAGELGKPLIVHTRAAEQDTIATLRERAAGVTVILHCFSMPAWVDECVQEGWWISFAGNVTYPKNEDLAAAAAAVPDDRLLVETDAPYLSPQGLRKEKNQPSFVTETARFVAEQSGQEYAELDAIVERNAAEVFGW
jgi:TatD DNase family protein